MEKHENHSPLLAGRACCTARLQDLQGGSPWSPTRLHITRGGCKGAPLGASSGWVGVTEWGENILMQKRKEKKKHFLQYFWLAFFSLEMFLLYKTQ